MKMFFRVINSFVPFQWVKIQIYWLFTLAIPAVLTPGDLKGFAALSLIILMSILLSGWLLGGMLFMKSPVTLFRDVVQEIFDVYQRRKQEIIEEDEWKLKSQSESNSDNT